MQYSHESDTPDSMYYAVYGNINSTFESKFKNPSLELIFLRRLYLYGSDIYLLVSLARSYVMFVSEVDAGDVIVRFLWFEVE